MLIHEHSRGIPRTINVICDNALMNGFALARRRVDREIVAEVVRDFDLGSVDVDPSKPDPRVDADLQPGKPTGGGSADAPAGEDVSEAAAGEERRRLAGAGKPRRFSLFRAR